MENGILNDEMSHMLANAINHYESIQHQEKLNLIIAKQDMVFIESFGLKPYKDGSEWCVLLGDNIQDGICGFGETPLKAVLDFNKNFISKQ
jgi:hypothetical protein